MLRKTHEKHMKKTRIKHEKNMYFDAIFSSLGSVQSPGFIGEISVQASLGVSLIKVGVYTLNIYIKGYLLMHM